MRTCRTVADVEKLNAASPLTCVLVDLHVSGMDVRSLVAAVKPARVVAFGSHVATQVLEDARAAGCDLVLPRSQFVQQLETRLPEWLAPV